MSFTWSRTGRTITSRCTLCGVVLVESHEPTLLRVQRGHDPATCLKQRDAAVFATSLAEVKAATTNSELRVQLEGYDTRKAVENPVFATGLVPESVGLTLYDGGAKTNRPTRERRTVLSTPSAINGKEAVDS